MFWSSRNDDETDSYIETPNVDNFGVSFIFERALRRLDVHAEQRKLQQDKFDSHLKKYENDIQVLELKLKNRDKDFDKLHDKFKSLQVQTSSFNYYLCFDMERDFFVRIGKSNLVFSFWIFIIDTISWNKNWKGHFRDETSTWTRKCASIESRRWKYAMDEKWTHGHD